MRPFWATPANPHHPTTIHPALNNFTTECTGTLARLIAYVGVLALLAIGDHIAVAYAMLALTLIPILEGVVVLKHADWIFKPAILIHWGTAAVMLMIVALFRGAM